MNAMRFAVVTCLFLTSPCYSDDKLYDFYIYFSECKTLLGIMSLSDDALQEQTASPIEFRCNKESKKVNCVIADETGKELTSNETYSIARDTPPHIWLDLDTGPEFITINTAESVAVVNTVLTDDKYLGSMICNGSYITREELEGVERLNALDQLEFEILEKKGIERSKALEKYESELEKMTDPP